VKSVKNPTNQSHEYEADKFKTLRAIKINIQKQEGLSNSKKPVFDFSLLYPRKNGLRRKSKVCPLDTQIK